MVVLRSNLQAEWCSVAQRLDPRNRPRRSPELRPTRQTFCRCFAAVSADSFFLAVGGAGTISETFFLMRGVSGETTAKMPRYYIREPASPSTYDYVFFCSDFLTVIYVRYPRRNCTGSYVTFLNELAGMCRAGVLVKPHLVVSSVAATGHTILYRHPIRSTSLCIAFQ